MRYISSLRSEDQVELRRLVRSGHTHKERLRAQAILWSHKGYKIRQIADLCEVDRDTVSRWLTRWEIYQGQGLKDTARSGRPPKLSVEEKKV